MDREEKTSCDNSDIVEKDRENSPGPSTDPETRAEPDEIAELVTQELMLRTSWSGRLPRPQDLREYDAIVPGAGRDIVDEMLQESKLLQRSVDIDERTSDRYLTILERQEDRAADESRSDREVRDRVLKRIGPLLYAPALLFVLVLFAPIPAAVQITALIVLAALYVVPLIMVILRGRVSDNERDTMKIVPEVTKAVMTALRQHEQSVGQESSRLPAQVNELDSDN